MEGRMLYLQQAINRLVSHPLHLLLQGCSQAHRCRKELHAASLTSMLTTLPLTERGCLFRRPRPPS